MQRAMQMRALAMKVLMAPIMVFAMTLLLISPARALAGDKPEWERPGDGWHEDSGQHGDGWHEDKEGRGCVASPENPSVLLTVLGALGALVIPIARQRAARKGRVDLA